MLNFMVEWGWEFREDFSSLSSKVTHCFSLYELLEEVLRLFFCEDFWMERRFWESCVEDFVTRSIFFSLYIILEG